jgi:hypothetical protein
MRVNGHSQADGAKVLGWPARPGATRAISCGTSAASDRTAAAATAAAATVFAVAAAMSRGPAVAGGVLNSGRGTG